MGPTSDPTDHTNGEAKRKRSLLSWGVNIVGFVLTLGAGYYAGRWIQERFLTPSIELEQGERIRVDLRGDEPQLGPEDALVTVIEFSDFQCPYCAKAAPNLKDAMDSFEDDVRLVFKHYPLPGHFKAIPAAKASWAAHQQGKFWAMHDYLFTHHGELSDTHKIAAELKLDGQRFHADFASDQATQAVDEDYVAGSQAGATGTPFFIVNGHAYSGALPTQNWREILAYEREKAQELVDKGTPRSQVYAKLMADAKPFPGETAKSVGRKPSEWGQKSSDNEPDPNKVYQVTADDRPQLGPDNALVTIVEFSDFQCPYCAKVRETLAEIHKKYPEDVRIVFRQRPLGFHKFAEGAARASLAAHRQGKFWEMHDKMFAEQKNLAPEQLVAFAADLGLDVEQFERDIAAENIAHMVREDGALATRYGAAGTPAFFINGRYLSGAIPLADFDQVIQEELKKAQEMLAQGVDRSEIFAKIMAQAEVK